MKKTKLIAPLVLLVGLFVLMFYWPKLAPFFNQNKIIGKTESLRGRAFVERKTSSLAELYAGSPLYSLDLIKTERGSQMTFSLSSSKARFRILENTVAALVESDFALDIILKQGFIEVIDSGRSNQVFIVEKGKRTPIQNYPELQDEPMELIVSPLKIAATEIIPHQEKLPEAPQVADTPDKVKSMLTSRLSSRVGFFYRCYSALLQKDSSAQGNIQIQISVTPSGDIKKITVLDSDFSDPDFVGCLKDVIKRTKFTPFSGNTAALILPLVFDKNSQGQ